MKTITMLEFRKNAGKIIRWSQKGQRMTITYRGKPVMKIEPILPKKTSIDDPFYSLGLVADNSAGSLSNEDMDKLIYEA
ncbi:MAG: type II toxin-antitoxin system Phd/YefM family antitoxin [Chitinivibrionales bacterium]